MDAYISTISMLIIMPKDALLLGRFIGKLVIHALFSSVLLSFFRTTEYGYLHLGT